MKPDNPLLAKNQLREKYRALRKEIAPATRATTVLAIQDHLLNSEEIRNANNIAAFASFDGEPNLSGAMSRLVEDGKTLALPVLTEEKKMEFRKWTPTTPGQTNRFGIIEPAQGRRIGIWELDVVLLPMVAWNAIGRRIGMGGGYYDRELNPLRDEERPLRVGVAFGVQQAVHLPTDPWDVDVHAVVSEKGWFTCRR
jgi:5-formyltetrahydrofolate cyclo-ligase